MMMTIYKEIIEELHDEKVFKEKYREDLIGGSVLFGEKEIEDGIKLYLLADIHADDKEERLRFMIGLSCEEHRDFFNTFDSAYKDFLSFTKDDLLY